MLLKTFWLAIMHKKTNKNPQICPSRLEEDKFLEQKRFFFYIFSVRCGNIVSIGHHKTSH